MECEGGDDPENRCKIGFQKVEWVASLEGSDLYTGDANERAGS